MTGEQQEGAAIGEFGKSRRGFHHCIAVFRRARIRQTRWRIKQRLPRIVEGTLDAQGVAAIGEAQPPDDVAEVASHRQGCGSEHPRSAARFEYAAQCGANIERHHLAGEASCRRRQQACAIGRRGIQDGIQFTRQRGRAQPQLDHHLAGVHCPDRIGQIAQRSDQRTHGRVDTAQIITPADARAASARASRSTHRVLQGLPERLVHRGQMVCRKTTLHQCNRKIQQQLLHLAGTELRAEELRGQIRQLMRFIEDHGIGAGQDVTEALLLQRQIRQQQMVVDHHQIRFIGATARRKYMAAAELGAAATRAAVAGGREPLAQRMPVRAVR